MSKADDNMTDMNEVVVIILFFLFFALEVVPIFFVIKYKSTKAISMRSPVLLVFNILGLILMNIIFFTYEILKFVKNLDVFCNMIVNHYFEFHLMVKIPYYLKLHRIYSILKYEKFNKEHPELREITQKNFSEVNYIKLYFLLIIISFITRIILIITLEDFQSEIMNPFHFIHCISDISKKNEASNCIFWIFVDFLDQAILLYFCSLLFSSQNFSQYFLKLELILYTVIWIAYPMTCRISQFETSKDFHKTNFYNTMVSFLCIMFVNMTVIVVLYTPLLSIYLQMRSSTDAISNIDYKSNRYNTSNSKESPLINIYYEADIFILDMDRFEDALKYAANLEDSKTITILLNFYKEVWMIDNEYLKLKLNILIDKFELIFTKYLSKRSTSFIDFPQNIYQECIVQMLRVKNEVKKLKIFNEAIKYVNKKLKEVKLPFLTLNQISDIDNGEIEQSRW